MAIQITNISPKTFTRGVTTPVTITGSGLANVTTAGASGQITNPPTLVTCAAGLPNVISDTQVQVNFTMNWTMKPAQDNLMGNLTVILAEGGGGTGQKTFTDITYRTAP